MNRRFSYLTDSDILKYAKSHGFFGMNTSAAYQKDHCFWNMVHDRGLDSQIFTRAHKNWKDYTDGDIVQYAKDKGFLGMRPSDVRKIDNPYVNIVYSRGWESWIFKKSEGPAPQELIEKAKDKGFYGMPPGEVLLRDEAFYRAVYRRGMVDTVFKRKAPYPNRSPLPLPKDNEELIEYAKDHGLYKIFGAEAKKKDRYFYNRIAYRGLFDMVFKRKNRKPRIWVHKSNEEMIEFAKANGIYGKMPADAKKIDESFFHAIYRRDLTNQILTKKEKDPPRERTRKNRSWMHKSDEEMIEFAKKAGIYGLSFPDAKRVDLSFCITVKNRDLMSEIFG